MASLASLPSLAEIVKARRAELGLSYSDVVWTSDGLISKTTVWEIERGRAKCPTPAKLEALATALALDYGDLMRAVGYLPHRGDFLHDERSSPG
jgi:transcriptional regulator with XRE-family HTH domain